MKAVILAGGDGTRLRPLSVNKPKPLAPLFGKPVLEYTVRHLRRCGVTGMTAALRAMPQAVIDHFGDGSLFGVRMEYHIEDAPLGTAGSVRACADMSGGGPLLVISGDGLCDFDLRAAAEFHAARRADVTLLLHRQPDPLAYGLVMTDRGGRVTRFIEKPSWGQVFTDTVNTGIYIIEPHILAHIPQNTPYDFARDLFPELLARGAALYGRVTEGYWRDIGDAASYLQCAFDALDGKIDLGFPKEIRRLARGVWSGSPIPAQTRLSPPCYIGTNVRIGEGARIGPYAILSDGTSIGGGAVVERSYLDGAAAGGQSDICGAIVCGGASVGEGARLHEGCVVGERAVIGAHAVVREGCRVWPGGAVEPGAGASGGVAASGCRRSLFDGGGRLSGRPDAELPPELALRLGAAAATAAGGETVAVAWSGGEAARMTASVIESGIKSAGSAAARHDAQFAACAAYAGGLYRFPLSIFVRQDGGRLELYMSDPDGLPVERSSELKIESLAARGETLCREARAVGTTRLIAGVTGAYEAAAVTAAAWFDPRRAVDVSVRAGSASGQALVNALREALCAVGDAERLPAFDVSDDGFRLTAIDESGRVMSHERLLCALCVFEASRGNNVLAAPYGAPMLLDVMGARYALEILRPGRDAGARALTARQPYLRDGVFMAARLTQAMMTSGRTLASMNDSLPPFYTSAAELTVAARGGAVMRELARGVMGAGGAHPNIELVEGLRARVDDGWVHVTPLPGRRALLITGEGATEEMASELCAEFKKRAEEADARGRQK